MRAETTIRVFGVYLFALGIGVVLAPGVVFALILLPAPGGDAVFFAGLLLAAIGYYFLVTAQPGGAAFARATVTARMAIALATLAAVLVGRVAPNFLVLNAIDVAGALWTIAALRRTGEASFRLW